MSGQMNFVAAAYIVTALTSLVVTGWAWQAMRRAERRVEQLREQP